MRVLRGYQLLGSLCLQAGYRAFIQKPKNHGLHHVALSLKEQLCCGCPLVLNPEAWSCEQDEDFVGRISRLSRKVDVRKQGYRVFNRLFFENSELLEDGGKDVRDELGSSALQIPSFNLVRGPE